MALKMAAIANEFLIIKVSLMINVTDAVYRRNLEAVAQIRTPFRTGKLSGLR